MASRTGSAERSRQSSRSSRPKSRASDEAARDGEIRSQVDDEPARVYKKGESFHEVPGAHHRVSENASGSMPAKLLAVFVVDSNEKELTTLDAKWLKEPTTLARRSWIGR